MKKILFLSLLAVMSFGLCHAAGDPSKKKESKVTTTVFVTDVECESCARRIMENVPVLGKGIKDVQVDVPSQRVTVVYDAAKNSDEEIVRGFARIKVKAEPVKKG